MPVIARYAVVTLIPFLLIVIGATLWGGAAVLALVWLTLIAAGMDTLLAPPGTDDRTHAPWSDRLSLGLGIAHLVLIPIVLVALASPGLGFGERMALFFATASFFGQVSHPNAHELIHRRNWVLRGVGAAVYTSVGFGHHVSAHRLVHHRHVGTEEDPNTPRPDEDFWDYLPRAWVGSFLAGFAREEEKLERKGLPGRSAHNPYLIWVGGAALAVALAFGVTGFIGGVALILLGMLTGMQILLSDYIQHYGLQRLEMENGRLEPMGPHHSWNAPRGFSSYLMMNAPAHSEHHLHPDRPYDRLDSQAEGPVLPYSMPIMAMLATIPSVWHRVMDRRALKVMEAAQHRLRHGPPIQPRRPGPVELAGRQVDDTLDEAPVCDEDAAREEEAGVAAAPVRKISDDDDLMARVARAAE